MRSRYMDYGLKQYIDNRGSIRGRVAEISSDIFAVLADGNLVYFLKDEKYISPMSIVLDEEESFKTKGISINDEVHFDSESVKIGYENMHISISDIEVLSLEETRPEAKGTDEILRENLIALEDCIYSNGKHEGIAPIVFELGEYVEGYENYVEAEVHNNLYTSLILDCMIVFMERMISGDIDEIWKYSGDIIGLGPGITPSSNDFLCGIMNTLVYAADFFNLNTVKVHRFNEELLLNLEYDRGKISHYIMRSSVYGKTQKIVSEVIEGMYSMEDEELFREKVKSLINFGDISGTDMLCGIYLGYRTLQSEKFREKLT